jgi:ATP-binding cassette subfamily G (WHITE) protein 2 (SNQ2)
LLVVTILRKIANQGRTVIATIHQPSSSVFEMFVSFVFFDITTMHHCFLRSYCRSQDDLLLLKKGGRTVFFGELGIDSCNLVTYFESLGAKQIHRGENPVSHQYARQKACFTQNS